MASCMGSYICHYYLSQYTRSPLYRGAAVTGSGDYIPRNPRENGANFSQLKREYSHFFRTQRSPQSHDRTEWANERGSVISSEADVVAFTLSPRAARCPTPHVQTMNCPPVHRYGLFWFCGLHGDFCLNIVVRRSGA